MARRKSQQLIMGEGNDVVEDWIGPGAAQLEVLEQYVKHIGNGELEIDWVKILTGIEGVSARQAEDISFESDADLLKFPERFSGINVDYEAWGGDMPGRDGIWIQRPRLLGFAYHSGLKSVVRPAASARGQITG